MKTIGEGIEEYIELKKMYGLKFEGATSVLRNYGKFCLKQKQKVVTTSSILDWVQCFPDATRVTISRKIQTIRGFTSYWRAFDPKTEIPPKELSRFQSSRSNPHIYSPQEIESILRETKKFKAEPGQSSPIRGQTFYTMFGLIASCGLRRNEAISLKRSQVDVTKGTLLIEMTKFRKSRVIPIHPTTLKKLREYAKYRDKTIVRPKCENFFVMNRGQAVDGDSIYYAFVHACQKAGLRPSVDGAGYPRIHDLRHTFVVRTILGWLRQKRDVHSLMPVLSTYVGHAEPTDTYWYLTGVPELMRFGLHEAQR